MAGYRLSSRGAASRNTARRRRNSGEASAGSSHSSISMSSVLLTLTPSRFRAWTRSPSRVSSERLTRTARLLMGSFAAGVGRSLMTAADLLLVRGLGLRRGGGVTLSSATDSGSTTASGWSLAAAVGSSSWASRGRRGGGTDRERRSRRWFSASRPFGMSATGLMHHLGERSQLLRHALHLFPRIRLKGERGSSYTAPHPPML